MEKLWLFLDLFRKGNAVADPKLWKDRTAITLALTALILTGCKVAKGFGHELPVSEADAASIAAGIAVVVGLLSNYITSDKVGLLPTKPEVPPVAAADPAGPEPAGRVNWVDIANRDFPKDTGGGS